jgi:type II secretory pathway pseudopilin PulG
LKPQEIRLHLDTIISISFALLLTIAMIGYLSQVKKKRLSQEKRVYKQLEKNLQEQAMEV